jgi:hypothetical protein
VSNPDPEIANLLTRIEELHDTIVWLCRFVCALSLLITIQVTIKYLLYRRIRVLTTRVEQMLELAEIHGGITDSKAREIKQVVGAGLKIVKDAVNRAAKDVKETLPAKVADEVKKQSGDAPSNSPESQTPLPIIVVPPTATG